MPTKHRVEAGDGIARIAFEHGFAPETIWLDQENSALRERRGHPEMLLEGDVVHVPDRRPKAVPADTDQRHRFRRRGVPAQIHLRLLHGSRPRSDEPFELQVDGESIRGRTDGDGWIHQWVSPAAQRVTLLLSGGAERHVLDVGRLDPVDTLTGVQRRLINLGHLCGAPTGELDVETKLAITRLQHAAGLAATGELDDATRATIVRLHGS